MKVIMCIAIMALLLIIFASCEHNNEKAAESQSLYAEAQSLYTEAQSLYNEFVYRLINEAKPLVERIDDSKITAAYNGLASVMEELSDKNFSELSDEDFDVLIEFLETQVKYVDVFILGVSIQLDMMEK